MLVVGAVRWGELPRQHRRHHPGPPRWRRRLVGAHVQRGPAHRRWLPRTRAQTLGQVVTPTLKHQKKQLERMPGIAELRDQQRKHMLADESVLNTPSPT